ncbi:MAG TPA: hypothetical protein VIS74_07445 [Chthoniobacterales bacterium]
MRQSFLTKRSFSFSRNLVRISPFVCLFAPTGWAASEFGSTDSSRAALIGTFYDLKQTQKLQPTGVTDAQYTEVLDEFLRKNWDEGVLNRYFRATQPLYTTQLFIPSIDAAAAPKAFGVEKIVKPTMWVAHYKGQVIPPTDGAWRFWGQGDDILCVAVNGRIVLINNWAGLRFPSIRWRSPEPTQVPCGKLKLAAGHWMKLKGGEPVDLDVLVGELPGGLFAAYLMIEKRGDSDASAGGQRLFPIFQLAPYDPPLPTDPSGQAPRFLPNGPIWKGVQ